MLNALFELKNFSVESRSLEFPILWHIFVAFKLDQNQGAGSTRQDQNVYYCLNFVEDTNFFDKIGSSK